MDKNIRKATSKDISRIAELMVINYRENFFQFFKNEAFYFGELNVLDVAQEYIDNPEMVGNTYVYDDGAVKGMVRLHGDEIVKLFVEPQFQSQQIGGKLLSFAMEQKAANWLWVLEYNARGIEFYKRNGFDFTGEKVMEEGWIPLLKMQCE